MTAHEHAYFDGLMSSELLGVAGQRMLEVIEGGLVAQSLNGVPAFVDDVAHALQHTIELRLERRLVHFFGDDVELHGGADESLQQRIVQLLRDPRPLRQTLFEPDVQLRGYSVQVKAIETPHCQDNQAGEHQHKGARLIERRMNDEVQRGTLGVPNAVVVGGNHTEPGRSWWQIGVEHLASPGRLRSERTLLLILREGCRYCAESMPFYRRLVEERARVEGKAARVVAVVLTQHGAGDAVAYIRRQNLQACYRTPTS